MGVSELSEQEQFDEGSKFFEKKDFKNALNLFKNVVRKNPKRPKIWLLVGYCYQHLNDYENALIAYKKGRELEPSYHGYLIQIGYILGQLKKDKEAVEIYQQLTSEQPNNVQGWFNLGCVYGRLGRFPEAIKAFEQSLVIDPKYIQAKYSLVDAYVSNKETEKAALLRSQLIFDSPVDPNNYFNLSKLLVEQNKFEEAIVYLLKALSIKQSEEYQIELKKLLTKIPIQANQINAFDFVENNNYQVLEIKGKSITSIKQIYGLKYFKLTLKALDLSHNNLTQIEGLEDLILLDDLNLGYNQIEKIEGLEQLITLSSLRLSNNKLSKMRGIENLKLKYLYLENNKLEEIEGLEKSWPIITLNLSNNLISKIANLEKLVNLNEINLAYNKITTLEGLERNISLTDINISYNDIQKYDDLRHLTTLQNLNLMGNEKLPDELRVVILHKKDISKFQTYTQHLSESFSAKLAVEKIKQEHEKWAKMTDVEKRKAFRMEKYKPIRYEGKPIILPFISGVLKENKEDQCLYCKKNISSDDNKQVDCENKYRMIINDGNKKIPESFNEYVNTGKTITEFHTTFTGSGQIIIPQKVQQMKKVKHSVKNFDNYVFETLAGTVCPKCAEIFLGNAQSTIKTMTFKSKSYEEMQNTVTYTIMMLESILDLFILIAEGKVKMNIDS